MSGGLFIYRYIWPVDQKCNFQPCVQALCSVLNGSSKKGGGVEILENRNVILLYRKLQCLLFAFGYRTLRVSNRD